MGKINETEKAGICFVIALQMNPNLNAARINLADILRHDGKYEEADREFAEVLRLDPNSAAAKFSAGMIALMLGDMKRGWELYESRFDTDSFPTKRFNTNKPSWQRDDLADKTMLLTSEQGMGDDIMFIRYAKELKKKWPACRVLFYGNALMQRLFKGVDGLDRVISMGSFEVSENGTKRQLSPGDKLDEFEYGYHCPLLSLPHRLGTTLEMIPSETPYIRNVGWQPYLEASLGIGKRLVGLCWRGSPRHGKDFFRSIEPEMFQPLIDAHPEIQFYSLQVGPRADEANRLRDIIDLAPTITDWTDTAQALMQLDLLISVDTALLHLAGALDRFAWALIPHSPDWRWMLAREDSPWYPKLRLFRQPTQSDWETPLKRIRDAL